MNETVNNFLLVGDKLMPERHLRQPGFTYSACGPFTKNKERNKKFKETGDTSYIYNMIWLMEILKFYQKELQQIKY